ncbi:TBC1 domain family member 2A-like isoform X2 [Acipenser ruthenus]|uniref:TBC1 domain family member 2A-like isoform X2 n=1 Tax=Acipenser ruthenus TaxID=7906 RepID=UPI002740358C|nr:TBC1 domain family member 2A-like isoform X2 [Acipenser ruthenus]XP_058883924.1 TBC1 domain family member 2A-like isoform X2 [Acipenser ruthenus]
MVRTVKMEQDCQVGKPMPPADPNLTSPDNHHDLTASAREEVGSTKENEGDSTHMDQSNAQEKPVMKTKMEPSSTKLCGYLNKLGGPLKAWKARWFVFEEKKCQLYYYRTSQDVNPLGSIDLANATFGYPDQAQEGTFQIQIPGRVVVLKALNSQAMLYWLQQLQIKRWQHNTSLVKIPAEPSTTSTQLCQLPSAPWEGRTEDFLPAVKTPKGLVGEAAASARPLATKCTAKALPQAPHHRDTPILAPARRASQQKSLNKRAGSLAVGVQRGEACTETLLQ